mgnify:CR=1 FL=1
MASGFRLLLLLAILLLTSALYVPIGLLARRVARATAVECARHGLTCLLVEKHAGTSIFPKARLVTTRTMELVRAWGLQEAVERADHGLRTFAAQFGRIARRALRNYTAVSAR